MDKFFAAYLIATAVYAVFTIAYIVMVVKSNKINRKHIEAINLYTDTVVEQNEYLKQIIGVKPKEE